eukprot:SAG25_NODE_1475_length_2947_cov_2.597612_1_plen_69_part_00
MQANPSACQAARRAPPRAAGMHAGKSQCMHAARGGGRRGLTLDSNRSEASQPAASRRHDFVPEVRPGC